MKVLIAPMAAMMETGGPISRSIALGKALLENGHEIAFCAAEDVNYRSMDQVKNYYAPIPSPFGMPLSLGKRISKVVQALGIQQKKKVNSFEQVLFFAGATNKKLFAEDVDCIRKAIADFQPDVVYAEFRIAAIVAAKLENKKVATGYSYPVQTSYASSPQYSQGVRDYLNENHLPKVQSALEIFDWADVRIIPSSFDLEPIEKDNVVFTGPFSSQSPATHTDEKKNILVYMGFGTLPVNTVIQSITGAFSNTSYQIYIATAQVKPYHKGNITVDKRFDFSNLMPGAAAYINHGGQNSIMTGLLFGVPQIVCPGNVFERRYNAASVAALGAGVNLEAEEFTAQNLKRFLHDFESAPTYSERSRQAGEQLASLGGAQKAVEALENLIK